LERIPDSEYRERIATCQDYAREKGFDAVLAYSDNRFSMGQGVECGQHVRYFVGFNFDPSRIQRDPALLPYLLGQGLVVIPAESEPALIITRESVELAKSQCWMKNIYSTAKDYVDNKNKGLARISRDILEQGLKKKRKFLFGISGVGMPFGFYTELQKAFPRSEFEDCTYDLDMLRAEKTSNELRIMREAARIADEGVRALIESSKPGALEYDVHQAVEKAMFDAGGDNPWSVILTGPRTKVSYMSPDFCQRTLEDGDMVFSDLGTELMGYHSDIQPAYIVGKQRAREKLKIVETSLNMLEAMIKATRPGATDVDIVNAAVKSISKTDLRDYLKTSTLGHGYGVGWEYPDLTGATPLLPKKRQTVIKKNMILCLEPGVIVPAVGGAAIEDEVIVTDGGCEVITKCAERARDLLRGAGA
jgi:Xaa-Pro aminopeptidase